MNSFEIERNVMEKAILNFARLFLKHSYKFSTYCLITRYDAKMSNDVLQDVLTGDIVRVGNQRIYPTWTIPYTALFPGKVSIYEFITELLKPFQGRRLYEESKKGNINSVMLLFHSLGDLDQYPERWNLIKEMENHLREYCPMESMLVLAGREPQYNNCGFIRIYRI